MNSLLNKNALVIALIGLAGTILTAYLTSGAALADIRGDVRVVEERENNHYAEVSKQLIEINRKLDTVLTQR